MFARFPVSIPWPYHFSCPTLQITQGTSESNASTLDAAGEMLAMIGHVFWSGRPSAAKTVSSAGGMVYVKTGSSITWATAGTTLRIGLQDIDNTTAGTVRPDETHDVYDDLVQGTDSVAANTWLSVAFSSGSKSVAQGDLIAVVIDMTVRNGADSVTGKFISGSNGTGWPGTVAKTGGAWGVPSSVGTPLLVLQADDGTIGFLMGGSPVGVASSQTFGDSSNPDEYGLLFRVSAPILVDGLIALVQNSAANQGWTITLYGDPLGTPVALATYAHDSDSYSNSARYIRMIQLSSEVRLNANTDYVVAVRGNGSSTLLTQYFDMSGSGNVAAALDVSTLLGLNAGAAQVTRNNGSGAFGSSDTTRIPLMGLLISGVPSGVMPTYQLGL